MHLKLSKHEIIDLIKAWLAISIAFAIVLKTDTFFSTNFIYNILLAALTVGVGFLLHELAHKIVALHYKCIAEFKSFDFMLVIAILISFLGFVFAAPGAVFIQGNVDRKKNGKISLAGPLTNIILALIFLSLSIISITFIKQISDYGFRINAWLALFNMLPFLSLDGAKVFRWNKVVYTIFLIISIILLIISF